MNDNLYDVYQTQVHDAMNMDEKATAALERKNRPEAITLYRGAASRYAQAAETLLQVAENCDANERADIEKSVDRLIGISMELKELALRLQEQKEEPRQQEPGLRADDEDLDVRFTPVQNLPKVSFEDIAGLEEAKQLIMEEIINPLLYEDLYQKFLIKTNGGLLLFGPPGSGKTMMARAVASQADMAFFSIKCSDIVGKYFGEAEKHVRALFQAARNARDAVVFFDEAEALACRRGSKSTVMNRLVPELLSQMDGFEGFDGHIIVIFATNRPFDIDPAFLRPGRLPNHCYISLPNEEVRRAYLRKHISMRPCEGNIDINALSAATDRFSCADLENLIKRACQRPVNRLISQRKEGLGEKEEVLRQEDLDRALGLLHPSVEQAEIDRLQKWMRQVGMRQAQAA